ncbi:MAG: HlyD family type I secretion periplasmic adaptor subunit [Magnetospirillum sp.]|nr:HlyD family type I secretion periplasmic adaptor subunit [Magnetospirillum sp.]
MWWATRASPSPSPPLLPPPPTPTRDQRNRHDRDPTPLRRPARHRPGHRPGAPDGLPQAPADRPGGHRRGAGRLRHLGRLRPLDSAVVTAGTVMVESKRKMVQHREGGIVSQILVKEGDQVAAGTVLVKLQDSTAQSQMETLRIQLDSKLAEQARLLAERDGLAAIAFPAELLDRRAEPKVAEILAREEDRFTQRAKTLRGERGILEARITQLESQHDGRAGLKQSTEEQMRLLEQEIEGLRGLTAKGYYPVNRLRAQERELARMKGEMVSDGASASQTDKEIGETRLQILQADQKFRDEVATDLTRVNTEVHDLTQKLVASGDAVQRLAVVAPVAGTVQNLKVAGPGTVVPPGGDLMEPGAGRRPPDRRGPRQHPRHRPRACGPGSGDAVLGLRVAHHPGDQGRGGRGLGRRLHRRADPPVLLHRPRRGAAGTDRPPAAQPQGRHARGGDARRRQPHSPSVLRQAPHGQLRARLQGEIISSRGGPILNREARPKPARNGGLFILYQQSDTTKDDHTSFVASPIVKTGGR